MLSRDPRLICANRESARSRRSGSRPNADRRTRSSVNSVKSSAAGCVSDWRRHRIEDCNRASSRILCRVRRGDDIGDRKPCNRHRNQCSTTSRSAFDITVQQVVRRNARWHRRQTGSAFEAKYILPWAFTGEAADQKHTADCNATCGSDGILKITECHLPKPLVHLRS